MAEVRQASPHFECHFVLWPLHVRQAEEVGIKPTLKMLKLGFMYSKIAQDLFSQKHLRCLGSRLVALAAGERD